MDLRLFVFLVSWFRLWCDWLEFVLTCRQLESWSVFWGNLNLIQTLRKWRVAALYPEVTFGQPSADTCRKRAAWGRWVRSGHSLVLKSCPPVNRLLVEVRPFLSALNCVLVIRMEQFLSEGPVQFQKHQDVVFRQNPSVSQTHQQPMHNNFTILGKKTVQLATLSSSEQYRRAS